MKKKCNYVCLSDLHLGARYSILSSRDEHTRFKAKDRSLCFTQLADGLRDLIPKVYDGQPPKLILLGDIVDFSFASMSDIVEALEVMIDVFFPDGESPMFQKEIIFIPGNHDHRFWQNEKDKLFLDSFDQSKRQSNEDLHYQTSDLFRSDSLPSQFLNQLPKARAKGLSFELRYPNWALYRAATGDTQSKQIVFHHGHYIEPLYRLMTTVNQVISNIDDPDIEELERQNGSWIHFFWSSLGASPAQRDATVLLFDIMQNPSATYQYSQKLAKMMADFLSTQVGMSPSNEVINSLTVEKLLTGILSATLGKGFHAERACIDSALSDEGWEGLHWYLSSPLHQQIIEDSKTRGLRQSSDTKTIETDTTFVFGHTHKPFQDMLGVTGYDAPVKLLNSGGWVVDEADFSSVQGGAAIFIDEGLNTASLRLFQAPVNGHMPEVMAEGVYHDEAESNPLLSKMRDQLDQSKWDNFQSSVQAAIELRALEVRDQFFDRYSNNGVKHHG